MAGTEPAAIPGFHAGQRPYKLWLINLGRATHAWIEQEYHQTRHPELDCTPLDRYRAGPDVGRNCPPAERLRRAFCIKVTRIQRRTDGTIGLHGRRFEIPREFAHVQKLRVLYARWDLSRVDLIDPRSGAVLCPLCPLYPLDKSAEAGAWRRVAKTGEAPPPAAGDMAPLLRKQLADFEATGLPPPYLASDDEDPS